MKKGEILIFGAGSVGSYLAAKLALSGHNINVIGRKAEKIGSYLYINDEKFHFPTTSTNINSQIKYNYIFLTCKIYDLKNNLQHLKRWSPKSEIIILLQNCFFDITEFKNTYPQELTSILVFDGFNLTGNRLKHTKGAGFLLENTKYSERLTQLLKDSNIETRTTDNMLQHRAEKTIYNCAINIFSAIYSKTVRELFANSSTLERMKNVFYESYEVLSQEIDIPQDKESLWNHLIQFAGTLNHYASTYQDVRENKVTEIAFLNGFIIDLGRKVGVATPYNIEAVKIFKKKYPNFY
ncbi:ketopantoate reductase family protein [Microbulbifer echini]|uniref:2-dehydropantoate 2-reductase n=1 Tax=Microbulbifer echini TaxID=1529067 RepID=A0ABV4NJF4_9GAMM